MEKHLDVDEGLHWLSHKWRGVLVGGLLVAGDCLGIERFNANRS